ncbi:MAG: hypothetical protein B1H12_09120 [Desulfobacteraceae bacterium 4484_190.2]|nr:MAG: hypothetical protein B1H12_09120 [Desulfobacteraceae bacterium 4484_190.2]
MNDYEITNIILGIFYEAYSEHNAEFGKKGISGQPPGKFTELSLNSNENATILFHTSLISLKMRQFFGILHKTAKSIRT